MIKNASNLRIINANDSRHTENSIYGMHVHNKDENSISRYYIDGHTFAYELVLNYKENEKAQKEEKY